MRENDYNEYFNVRRPAKFAEKYLYFWHYRMFNIACKSIKDFKRKSLLEVGVGFGYFANICRNNGLSDYVGIDMNKAMIESLLDQGFNAICSSIPPFPDINNNVDVIWMSQVIEHAKDYMHARDMLQSAYDKLNHGGYVVVIAPDYASWGKYFYDIDWSHGFPVTLKRVNQMLSDVGFSITVSKHHVATITNEIASTLLNTLFKLVPVGLLDYISSKISGKTFPSSFMSMFGWRQIVIIAKK